MKQWLDIKEPIVGQELEIEGRVYWVTAVSAGKVEVMPDPDRKRAKPSLIRERRPSDFWSTFWCIVLICVLIKLVF